MNTSSGGHSLTGDCAEALCRGARLPRYAVLSAIVGRFLAWAPGVFHYPEVFHDVSVWSARSRQRRQLASLTADARLLNDVGLSRSDALQEVGKPFWKP